MSRENKIAALKAAFDNFRQYGLDQFFQNPGAYNDWEGYSFTEFQQAVMYLRDTYIKAFQLNVFSELPFSVVNNLLNQFNSFNLTFTSLISQKNQGAFQNCATQLDALVNLTLVYEIHDLVYSGKAIQNTQQQVEATLTRLTQASDQVELLRRNVQELIEPAVSGSLSKAFSDRTAFLFKSRVTWGVITVIVALLVVWATYTAVQNLLVDIYNKTNAEMNKQMLIPIVLLRFLLLVPVYAGFIFVFGQYRKERNLEEEYAHRAAVATSLPNYGDLAKDNNVRDQIVSAATNVIFTSPSHEEKDSNRGTDLKSVGDFMDAFGRLTDKLRPK